MLCGEESRIPRLAFLFGRQLPRCRRQRRPPGVHGVHPSRVAAVGPWATAREGRVIPRVPFRRRHCEGGIAAHRPHPNLRPRVAPEGPPQQAPHHSPRSAAPPRSPSAPHSPRGCPTRPPCPWASAASRATCAPVRDSGVRRPQSPAVVQSGAPRLHPAKRTARSIGVCVAPNR